MVKYKKEYGYTFDEYLDQLALERLQEIRGEIKSLEKKVVKEYQEKGYSVSIEELDLDREIQLIVKFNKN